jgi:glycerophosphoryl diester phosphodiesterase
MRTKYDFLSQSTPHLIAHRGGNAAGKNKQNTLAAFQSAADLGYKYIETDALLTSDGQVVVYHGSKNRRQQIRTSQKRRKTMQNMTYAGINKQISPGGERVPLLEEALEAFPDIRFNIDAKTKEVVKPLADVIKRTKTIKRVCIASFSYKRTQGVAQLLGGQQKVCTSIGPAGFSAYFIHSRMNRLFKQKLGSLEVGCIQIPYRFTSKNLIDAAHAHGKMVHVWTVNNTRHMARLLDLGVDGIVTDETKALQTLANRRK